MFPPLVSTVLLDPPTTLLAGTAIALVSARLISKDPDREVFKTAAFSAAWAAVYGLAVGDMFFAFPDWMFAYLKDANSVPLVPSYLVFLAVLIAFGFVGGLGGAALIARRQLGAAFLLFGAALLSLFATFYLQWDQYQLAGTLADYSRGSAPRLLDVPAAKFGMNLASAVVAVGSLALLAGRLLPLRRAAAKERA